jgi:hypothetical protein
MARPVRAGRIVRIVGSLAVGALVIWPILLYARHFLVWWVFVTAAALFGYWLIVSTLF